MGCDFYHCSDRHWQTACFEFLESTLTSTALQDMFCICSMYVLNGNMNVVYIFKWFKVFRWNLRPTDVPFLFFILFN